MLKRFIFGACMCLLSMATCADGINYIGLDYKFRRMDGRSADTYNMSNALSDRYEGGQIYAIHRFENNVGLGLGFEQSKKRTSQYVFSAGELFTGTQQANDVSEISTVLRAIQLNLLGYLNYTPRFAAVGQLGLSLFNADMQGVLKANNLVMDLAPHGRWMVIPTIGFGLQYLLNGMFGIRGMITWEGTETYEIDINNDDGVRRKIRPFDSSWAAVLGVILKI